MITLKTWIAFFGLVTKVAEKWTKNVLYLFIFRIISLFSIKTINTILELTI